MSEVIFTDREMDVMAILWDLGSGTVSDVRDRLEDDLAYTTVLTILRTLEEKGHVRHEKEGRAYRYFPAVERNEARESHLRRLMRKLFAGSPELMMSHLVSDRTLTSEEVQRLREVIDERLN